MDRLRRLTQKAEKILNPPPSICERLLIDNPYTCKSFSELLDYLDAENRRAPEMHTHEWNKYMAALMSAPH